MALKAAKGEDCEENEDVAYLIERFIKVMTRNRRFRRRNNSKRSATGNNLCHKYVKANHFIKDHPIHKLKHKDYGRDGPDKGKQKD